MRHFLVKWFAMSVAVLAASYVVPGIVISDVGAAVIAALFLGLANAFLRPLLVLLTLPLTILTFGLFLLLLNAALLSFVAWIVDGFFVTGFWPALIGTIFISILSGIVNGLIKPRRVH
jgi:putative membrane protein